MNRREQGDLLWKQRFDVIGMSAYFELINRDWDADAHGGLTSVRCKTCGTLFKTWNVRNCIYKNAKTLICPQCGQQCEICGKEYTIRTRMEKEGLKYCTDNGCCSNACARKRSHRKRKETGYPKSHLHRAHRYGCEYDGSVTLKRLIKRDGLRCAICGEMCDPDDHSWTEYSGPMCPTIDHIIPMSKGGGHTWDNVQIAHAICNSIKRDTLEEVSAYDAS